MLCFVYLFSKLLTFLSPQVWAEFKRVVSTDLLESFLNGLYDLVPRLLEVYKAATKLEEEACAESHFGLYEERCELTS